jgi:hypothetical protein
MNANKILILHMIGILLISTAACGQKAAIASIGNAWLATDEKGATHTTVYSQDATFNLIVELNNAASDTQLKAIWVAVNAEGLAPNSVIHETNFISNKQLVRFYLANDAPWALGSYKVDIYLNGIVDKSLAFEVK